MKRIPLTQGEYALVDDEDYERVVAEGSWFVHRGRNSKTLYAYRSNPHTQMHRFILQAPVDIEVDHADLNGLNNQRSNLRLATKSDSQRNKGISSNNTSGFKGVSWHRHTSKWRATIKVDDHQIQLGGFTDPMDAAKAYDRAAIEYHGEFAVTNAQLGRY
jgi:hypothetical protein